MVLRYLGDEIVAQSEGGSSLFDEGVGVSYRSREMPDLWLLEEDPGDTKNPVEMTNRLPTMQGPHDDWDSPEWTTRKHRTNISEEVIGLTFDGLKRGMHLNILWMEDNKTLTVHWQGFLVYKEVSGDLRSYIPGVEWEAKIDTLYKVAKPVRVEREKEKKEIAEEVSKKQKMSWMQSIIKRWGAQ